MVDRNIFIKSPKKAKRVYPLFYLTCTQCITGECADISCMTFHPLCVRCHDNLAVKVLPWKFVCENQVIRIRPWKIPSGKKNPSWEFCHEISGVKILCGSVSWEFCCEDYFMEFFVMDSVACLNGIGRVVICSGK